MEIVDIVDEKDVAIGRCSKEEAHKKGHLHRTIIAEVIDSQGRFLLARPASHKQDPGQLVSPMGGHIQSGETEVQALYREVEEEVGIKEFSYKFIGKLIFNRKVLDRIENHYFIVYEITSNQKPVVSDESELFEWFTVPEICRHLKKHPEDFGDAFIPIIRNFYPQFLS